MTWLLSKGASVYRPVFHSPDVDLIAVAWRARAPD